MRRLLRSLLNVVIAGGLVLAAWPLGQSIYGQWSQHQLAAQWQRDQKPAHGAKKGTAQHVKPKTITPAAASAKAHQRPQAALVSTSSDSPTLPVAAGTPPKHWALTKLSIPDIGLETFIVQGWDDAALRRGPGHLPQSSPAGQGNCVVAGHRNVYGSPFYRLDELLPGANITLENHDGTFHYIVSAVFPTPDTNMQILLPPATGEAPRLTILTCTLPHTNNRVVVQALLSTTEP